jgi:hypothetical protein
MDSDELAKKIGSTGTETLSVLKSKPQSGSKQEGEKKEDSD